MALRTNPEEVKTLLQDDEAVIPLYMIEIASNMVDRLLVGSGLDDKTLRFIEGFLTCHVYAHGTPDVVRETYAGATFEYPRSASVFDKGYAATKWGQQAMALDTTGTLKRANKTPIAMHVI